MSVERSVTKGQSSRLVLKQLVLRLNKWPRFFRCHFQKHLRNWKCFCFYSVEISLKLVFKSSIGNTCKLTLVQGIAQTPHIHWWSLGIAWRQTGSLALNRWQAITRINVGLCDVLFNEWLNCNISQRWKKNQHMVMVSHALHWNKIVVNPIQFQSNKFHNSKTALIYTSIYLAGESWSHVCRTVMVPSWGHSAVRKGAWHSEQRRRQQKNSVPQDWHNGCI